MRRKVHYVIQPGYLWNSIHEHARTQDPELLQTLERAFQYIENQSFESRFQGLFSEINLNSEKLGRTPAERNRKLCTIIAKIADGIAQFSTARDILGDAYEYLIGQFAAGARDRARPCDGLPTPPQVGTGGADLLYASTATDTSLVRLRHRPPPGVAYAPWSAAAPTPGQRVVGIHHPRSSAQCTATGTLTETIPCPEIADCPTDSATAPPRFLRVTWTHGTTRAGSSGSGLFDTHGRLIGTLYGGFASPHGPDDYGRFDLAYRHALHRWLGRAPD